MVITFDKAVEQSDGKNRALLVGNGFSSEHFSYKTLLEKCGLDAGGPPRTLFDVLQTVDFELVIKALEDAAVVEKSYGRDARAAFLSSEADKVRRALVHAIRQIHPEHRDDIADVIPPCVEFLSKFETVFTLNYDLLLYWVGLEDGQLSDGFGLGEEDGGFRGPFKIGANCNTYNLHGGLHLFLKADGEIEKRVRAPGEGIVDAIASTITIAKRLPLYVAEGTSSGKLARIYSVPYLRYCYEMLGGSSGVFFIYGHSASSNDAHIYEALFQSDIEHLYFCVHQPTEAKIATINGELARYKARAQSEIEYTFVDSASAKVWGD